MNWYYARADERMGPVDDDEILRLAGTGEINAQTLVWRDGMADWAPWGQVSRAGVGDFADDGLSEGQRVCAECGLLFPADELVDFQGYHVCGTCKPVFFQRIREGGAPLTAQRYAGFWIRFVARIVDTVPFILLQGVMSLIEIEIQGGFDEYMDGSSSGADIAISILFWFIYTAISLAYEIWFTGRFGGTLGKLLLGLRVVRSDGSPITYGRSTGRAFATWLSSLTLLIGYIIAAFDGEKRTLHDHICDTRVVHK